MAGKFGGGKSKGGSAGTAKAPASPPRTTPRPPAPAPTRRGPSPAELAAQAERAARERERQALIRREQERQAALEREQMAAERRAEEQRARNQARVREQQQIAAQRERDSQRAALRSTETVAPVTRRSPAGGTNAANSAIWATERARKERERRAYQNRYTQQIRDLQRPGTRAEGREMVRDATSRGRIAGSSSRIRAAQQTNAQRRAQQTVERAKSPSQQALTTYGERRAAEFARRQQALHAEQRNQRRQYERSPQYQNDRFSARVRGQGTAPIYDRADIPQGGFGNQPGNPNADRWQNTANPRTRQHQRPSPGPGLSGATAMGRSAPARAPSRTNLRRPYASGQPLDTSGTERIVGAIADSRVGRAARGAFATTIGDLDNAVDRDLNRWVGRNDPNYPALASFAASEDTDEQQRVIDAYNEALARGMSPIEARDAAFSRLGFASQVVVGAATDPLTYAAPMAGMAGAGRLARALDVTEAVIDPIGTAIGGAFARGAQGVANTAVRGARALARNGPFTEAMGAVPLDSRGRPRREQIITVQDPNKRFVPVAQRIRPGSRIYDVPGTDTPRITPNRVTDRAGRVLETAAGVRRVQEEVAEEISQRAPRVVERGPIARGPREPNPREAAQAYQERVGSGRTGTGRATTIGPQSRDVLDAPYRGEPRRPGGNREPFRNVPETRGDPLPPARGTDPHFRTIGQDDGPVVEYGRERPNYGAFDRETAQAVRAIDRDVRAIEIELRNNKELSPEEIENFYRQLRDLDKERWELTRRVATPIRALTPTERLLAERFGEESSFSVEQIEEAIARSTREDEINDLTELEQLLNYELRETPFSQADQAQARLAAQNERLRDYIQSLQTTINPRTGRPLWQPGDPPTELMKEMRESILADKQFVRDRGYTPISRDDYLDQEIEIDDDGAIASEPLAPRRDRTRPLSRAEIEKQAVREGEQPDKARARPARATDEPVIEEPRQEPTAEELAEIARRLEGQRALNEAQLQIRLDDEARRQMLLGNRVDRTRQGNDAYDGGEVDPLLPPHLRQYDPESQFLIDDTTEQITGMAPLSRGNTPTQDQLPRPVGTWSSRIEDDPRYHAMLRRRGLDQSPFNVNRVANEGQTRGDVLGSGIQPEDDESFWRYLYRAASQGGLLPGGRQRIDLTDLEWDPTTKTARPRSVDPGGTQQASETLGARRTGWSGKTVHRMPGGRVRGTSENELGEVIQQNTAANLDATNELLDLNVENARLRASEAGLRSRALRAKDASLGKEYRILEQRYTNLAKEQAKLDAAVAALPDDATLRAAKVADLDKQRAVLQQEYDNLGKEQAILDERFEQSQLQKTRRESGQQTKVEGWSDTVLEERAQTATAKLNDPRLTPEQRVQLENEIATYNVEFARRRADPDQQDAYWENLKTQYENTKLTNKKLKTEGSWGEWVKSPEGQRRMLATGLALASLGTTVAILVPLGYAQLAQSRVSSENMAANVVQDLSQWAPLMRTERWDKMGVPVTPQTLLFQNAMIDHVTKEAFAAGRNVSDDDVLRVENAINSYLAWVTGSAVGLTDPLARQFVARFPGLPRPDRPESMGGPQELTPEQREAVADAQEYMVTLLDTKTDAKTYNETLTKMQQLLEENRAFFDQVELHAEFTTEEDRETDVREFKTLAERDPRAVEEEPQVRRYTPAQAALVAEANDIVAILDDTRASEREKAVAAQRGLAIIQQMPELADRIVAPFTPGDDAQAQYMNSLGVLLAPYQQEAPVVVSEQVLNEVEQARISLEQAERETSNSQVYGVEDPDLVEAERLERNRYWFYVRYLGEKAGVENRAEIMAQLGVSWPDVMANTSNVTPDMGQALVDYYEGRGEGALPPEYAITYDVWEAPPAVDAPAQPEQPWQQWADPGRDQPMGKAPGSNYPSFLPPPPPGAPVGPRGSDASTGGARAGGTTTPTRGAADVAAAIGSQGQSSRPASSGRAGGGGNAGGGGSSGGGGGSSGGGGGSQRDNTASWQRAGAYYGDYTTMPINGQNVLRQWNGSAWVAPFPFNDGGSSARGGGGGGYTPPPQRPASWQQAGAYYGDYTTMPIGGRNVLRQWNGSAWVEPFPFDAGPQRSVGGGGGGGGSAPRGNPFPMIEGEYAGRSVYAGRLEDHYWVGGKRVPESRLGTYQPGPSGGSGAGGASGNPFPMEEGGYAGRGVHRGMLVDFYWVNGERVPESELPVYEYEPQGAEFQDEIQPRDNPFPYEEGGYAGRGVHRGQLVDFYYVNGKRVPESELEVYEAGTGGTAQGEDVSPFRPFFPGGYAGRLAIDGQLVDYYYGETEDELIPETELTNGSAGGGGGGYADFGGGSGGGGGSGFGGSAGPAVGDARKAADGTWEKWNGAEWMPDLDGTFSNMRPADANQIYAWIAGQLSDEVAALIARRYGLDLGKLRSMFHAKARGTFYPTSAVRARF